MRRSLGSNNSSPTHFQIIQVWKYTITEYTFTKYTFGKKTLVWSSLLITLINCLKDNMFPGALLKTFKLRVFSEVNMWEGRYVGRWVFFVVRSCLPCSWSQISRYLKSHAVYPGKRRNPPHNPPGPGPRSQKVRICHQQDSLSSCWYLFAWRRRQTVMPSLTLWPWLLEQRGGRLQVNNMEAKHPKY